VKRRAAARPGELALAAGSATANSSFQPFSAKACEPSSGRLHEMALATFPWRELMHSAGAPTSPGGSLVSPGVDRLRLCSHYARLPSLADGASGSLSLRDPSDSRGGPHDVLGFFPVPESGAALVCPPSFDDVGPLARAAEPSTPTSRASASSLATTHASWVTVGKAHRTTQVPAMASKARVGLIDQSNRANGEPIRSSSTRPAGPSPAGVTQGAS
jgi:hypothetical protein